MTIALIISLILFVALFTVYAYQANRFVGVALAQIDALTKAETA